MDNTHTPTQASPIATPTTALTPISAPDLPSNLTPQETVEALRRLDGYIIKLPASSDRERQNKLNPSQLAIDILNLLGQTELVELHAHITRQYGIVSAPLRRRRRAPMGVDIVRERDQLRRRKNNLSTSGLTIGQVTYSEITRLAPPNPDDPATDKSPLQAAALVYLLVKQGAFVFKYIDLPTNAELMYTIKVQAPKLYKFLMADHVEHLQTEHPSLYRMSPLHDRQRLPDDKLLDDLSYLDAWDDLIDDGEFEAIGQTLDTFLRYIAQLPLDQYYRPQIVINPDIVSLKVGRGSLIPCVFGNELSSQYNISVVNYSRVALAVCMGRHDLWGGWRGENDRRYYAEHGRYATRGSKNRLFGWACKRLDIESNTNTETDQNPYSLVAFALRLIEEHSPYKRMHDERDAWTRLIEDTQYFDTRLGEFVKREQVSLYKHAALDDFDPNAETMDDRPMEIDARRTLNAPSHEAH